jgi:hypothetical protein
MTPANAKKKFGIGTDYEVATVDGVKVVHRRKEDRIAFGGKIYDRQIRGMKVAWVTGDG